VTGSDPERAAILKRTKVFMGVMGMECLTAVGRVEPFPKLNVVGESLPVKIRLAPTK